MVVYWEYAFLENFLLDALLLCLALGCARTKISVWNLLAASAIGAAEAIVFPLFSLPVWAAYAVKLTGGAVLPVVAVRKGTKRNYFIATVSFFVLTFILGGMLVALYSFFGTEYAEGNGYLVERAPIGLVFACAGLFALTAWKGIRALYRRAVRTRSLFPCKLYGEREVNWTGLCDSGNLLFFRGKPVCVLSAAALYVLLGGRANSIGRMKVSTVNGEREAPVYECRRMEVGGEAFENVPLIVGAISSEDHQIILHTAYTEGNYESSARAQSVASKEKDKRKRRALSVRERGASASSLDGGRERTPAKVGSGGGRGAGEGEAHRT